MNLLLRFPALRVALGIVVFVFLSLWLVPAPVTKLFSDKEFLPHATCYLRNKQLIWLHATSDMVIGLSYVAISSTLAYLVYRARKQIPFHWMFLAFGLFIVTCGFTHFMEVWTVWQPVYWLAGYVKIVTAMASFATALFLPPLVPKVIALINSAQVSEQRKKDLERLNEELVESNEGLQAFTFSASHDLRAPLRTMTAMSQILTRTLPKEGCEESVNYARRINLAASRMTQLLDDLLAYSASTKLEEGLATVSVEECILEVLQDLDEDIKKRNAQIHVEKPLPMVMGNKSFLKLSFANLIGNALKYVPADRSPEIRISACHKEGVDEISVEDNGVGIPEKYLQKIFEPFERLESSPDNPGTGLGLAIVSRAVRRMNGEVGVKSRLNHGSTFWLRLKTA